LDSTSTNAIIHQEKLDFSKSSGSNGGEEGGDDDDHGRFGLWSIRFSGDDREIVAGASDNALYVYDIETKKVTFRAKAHRLLTVLLNVLWQILTRLVILRNHVNAVAFANASNSNLVFSGGDDALIYGTQ